MQHDPVFAERVLRGEPATRHSLGLSEDEYAALCRPGAAAFRADRHDKRQQQFLRNVSSEFRASQVWGPRGDGDRAWVSLFTASEEFHRCLQGAGRLPLAFGDYAARVGQERGDPAFCALVDLESAMARTRRTLAVRPQARRAEFVLAPWVQLCRVPAGTHPLATRLQEAGGADTPDPQRGARDPVDEERAETVLLRAAEAEPAPGALRGLHAEALTPLVALFLRGADTPQNLAVCREFASDHEVDSAAVDSVLADFVAERVLLLGDEREG